MVYTRFVYSYSKGKKYGPYGPYRYRSEREGSKVHSIYLGPGGSTADNSSVTNESLELQREKVINNSSNIESQGDKEMSKGQDINDKLRNYQVETADGFIKTITVRFRTKWVEDDEIRGIKIPIRIKTLEKIDDKNVEREIDVDSITNTHIILSQGSRRQILKRVGVSEKAKAIQKEEDRLSSMSSQEVADEWERIVNEE